MAARLPEARLRAAAQTGLGLVLVVIVLSVAIRLGAEPVSALRGLHRTAASLEVLAMLALAWLAWRRALLVIGLTVFLSVLGILAGQRPPPPAALGNLLGGLALAAAFAWTLGRAQPRASERWGRLGHAVAALVAAQCVLGAWLAIFAKPLESWVLGAHTALGFALAAGAVWLALRPGPASRRLALFGVALAAPAAGIASAQFYQPLGASLAHGAAAALFAVAAAYAHARLT
jgi:hypothetical protein